MSRKASIPSAAARPQWAAVIDDFRRALRVRSADEMHLLLSRYPLHLFLHLDAAELRTALDVFGDERAVADGNVTAMRILLHDDPTAAVSASDLRPSARAGRAVGVAYMAALRLQGRHRDAHAVMLHRLPRRSQPMHPIADSHDGWPQFHALQNGLTAIMMGDVSRALSALEEARWRAITPGLEVITRDALAKAALVHAAFGDPAVARALATQCAAIERSTSWAEAKVDVAWAVVEAMLCHDAADARSRLEKIELSRLGEIWPFYVQAEYRALDSLGAFAHAAGRLTELTALPFAFEPGQGYAGSVLPLMMALNGIATGDPAAVRRHLADCDQRFALTGIVQALYALQIGAVPDAIAQALKLRGATRRLRRIELWRLSILGDAHLAAGDMPAAIRALRETALLPEPLSSSELGFFSNELRAVGGAHVAGWPVQESPDPVYMDHLPRRENHLTEREVEVVRYLNLHASRRDLAEALFVSPNTLKTQLRSIFRKLGATSRDEALHEAALRGIL
ncbi:helix-turn-helix transcriptional regulator [Microbacterium esteraromaticum]|uniref:helix-turn-helix domain-containing protein n=1 Tax=Microbacterium esteraromaticum TaxID=57043 RepID=UPI001C961FB7|nr:helix-turn-helix transcriptional regulator [Microbacterium esteraromaticum]MBY6059842.1 helix-turn-helix transcriptional regulator [Microbacterium esteraromaticum]